MRNEFHENLSAGRRCAGEQPQNCSHKGELATRPQPLCCTAEVFAIIYCWRRVADEGHSWQTPLRVSLLRWGRDRPSASGVSLPSFRKG